MQKKLTITLDERVYRGLHTVVGGRRISQFIEGLVRPYVLTEELDLAYREMAQAESREAEALEWAEATVGDGSGNKLLHSESAVERQPHANRIF